MKKKAAVMAAGMLMAGVTAGCSSGGGEEGGGSDAETMNFLTANSEGGDTRVIMDLAEQYQEEEGGMEVELETVPQTDLQQRIQTLSSSNDLPDMFEFESNRLQDLIEADQIVNIEEEFEDLGLEDSLNPAAVDLLKGLSGTDGLYAVPVELNIEGFWFNEQLLEEAGVEQPETWDEMLEVSETLQSQDIQPFAVAGQEKWPITRLINAYAIREYGSDAMDRVAEGELSITDDGFVEATETVQNMADQGYFGEGANTLDANAALDIFLQGDAAMYYSGSWSLSDFNNEEVNQIGIDNIGFFNIPEVEGGEGSADDYSINAGLVLAFSKDNFDEQTAEWVEYVFSRYPEKALEDYGFVSGFKVEDVPDNVDPLTELVVDEIDQVEEGALWFEANFDAETQREAEDGAQQLINNSVTAEEYLQGIEQTMQE